MANLSPSPLDKLYEKFNIPYVWYFVLISLTLYLIPIIIIVIGDLWDEFFYDGLWRTLLLAPTIILYIIALGRPMNQSLKRAILALRQIIDVEEDEFNQIVDQATDIDDRLELVGFAVGAVFGVLVASPWQFERKHLLLGAYYTIANAVMFGSLSWIIVTSIASTRLETELHKLPMHIDLFNLKPFEPIGRHSLFVTLAFIGGCVISVIFIPITSTINISSLITYLILVSVAILMFFLSMRPTHRRLADEKSTELEATRREISACFHSLRSQPPAECDFQEISTQLELWLKYEERLKDARTWPYNTAMLRTLFLSVLLPALASLAQRLVSSLLMK